MKKKLFLLSFLASRGGKMRDPGNEVDESDFNACHFSSLFVVFSFLSSFLPFSSPVLLVVCFADRVTKRNKGSGDENAFLLASYAGVLWACHAILFQEWLAQRTSALEATFLFPDKLFSISFDSDVPLFIHLSLSSQSGYFFYLKGPSINHSFIIYLFQY